MTEAPVWQQELQAQTLKFGTTEPLILTDMRPLHSENGRPYLSDEIPPDHVIVRFASRRTSGGREGIEGEFASYAEVLRSYDDSLGLISYLRDMIYPYKYKTTPDAIISVLHAIDGLPYWMIYRSDNPIENGKIPQYIMGAGKTIKGVLAPFVAFKDGIRDPLTGGIVPKPTIDELTHTEPFLDFVLSNHLLVHNGHSCPSTEQDIVRVAKALFEGPTDDKDRVGQMAAELGISYANKNRIRKFGSAFAVIADAGVTFDGKMSRPHNLSDLLSGRPVIFYKAGQEDGPIELVTDTLGKINTAQATMNQTLRRNVPHPLKRADLIRLRPLIRI